MAGMHKKWRLRRGGARADTGRREANELAGKLAIHPLVAELLCRRGLDTPELAESFLKPKLTQLHDPARIPGLTRAAERITQAIRDKQPIVIYGDYDVDGVTACAILWHTLNACGADARAYVPHRIEEGYGLNVEAIRLLASGKAADGNGGAAAEPSSTPSPSSPLRHPVPVVVSVDCGITAVEPARVAKELSVDLIITDHHEFDPAHLPDAHTLVHPRLPGSEYPFPHLCGAGVAFKLAWQVCKVFCGSERVSDRLRTLLVDLLSFAALGTITDVVPLLGENRVIAACGLGQIKRTPFTGLNALIDASKLRDEKIDAYHVGFVLGPRLNACGRMGHARQAVHMLTAAGPVEAAQIAAFLTEENDRRRATERQIFEEARRMVVDHGYDHRDCRAIVLGKEGWHEGVVGIVASRLVETFARPAVVLNFSGGEEGVAHGSARSVEGLSIHEAFTHCADHLTTFGGHAMAAGLRLAVPRVEGFRQALVGFVNARIGADDLVATLDIDLDCTLDDLTVDLADQVQKLAPFGAANPSPVFRVRGATLEQPARRMGNAGKHLSFMLRQGRRVVRGVAWNMGDLADQLPAGVRVDVVFEPKINQWQGVRNAELHAKDLRVLSE